MNIAYIEKSTLIDYPGKIACTVFTQGCNFRCGYCHNPELVPFTKRSKISADYFFSFLRRRRNLLDGVCITGGEPTMQPDLIEFIKRIKKHEFSVKLDTQGSMPNVLKQLLEKNLVDYIAMDIKGPLEKYFEISTTKIDTSRIKESVSLVMKSRIDYEFRTTVVKGQLGEEDFEKIASLISGAKRYYLQKFVPTKVNDKSFLERESYSDSTLNNFKKILEKKVERVYIR